MVDVSKTLPLILMAIAALCLASCDRVRDFIQHGTPTMSQADKDKLSVPLHESWCYQSLGQIDCYVQPQPDRGSQLVNVDPQSRLPLTEAEHKAAVAAGR